MDVNVAALSPLCVAAEAGDLMQVQALVTAGADLESKKKPHLDDIDNMIEDWDCEDTPLHCVVEYLIACGANKKAVDFMGETPCIIAAANGHLPVVHQLLKPGFERLATDEDACWALTRASCSGQFDIVEYLLERGCDVNCVAPWDYVGRTALHWASQEGRLEVAQLLMRWGANLDARTADGRSELPIDVAMRRGHHNVANAIRAEEIRRRDHGFKRDPSTIEGTEEHEAAKRPRVEEQPKEEEADLSDDDDDEDDDEEEGA